MPLPCNPSHSYKNINLLLIPLFSNDLIIFLSPMIDQEESGVCDSAYALPGSLIDQLLDDDLSNIEIFQPSEEQFQKQNEESEHNDPQEEKHDTFRITLLEKEESNCYLPEKPYQELCEEDPLLLRTPQKRLPMDSPFSLRKDSKIDKLAYQEETRSDKIERYRMKKTRRVWGRKVFYDCRKVVADSRTRVNGRFVKKSPVCTGLESIHKNSLVTGELELREPMQDVQNIQDFYL